MRIITNLSDKKPPVLTIGTFDGMHLGHQALLKRLKEIHPQPAVVTFENHPQSVLNPSKQIQNLCTLEHKLSHIEQAGIETVILLPFTKSLSFLTAEEFLQKLKPFSHLLLGYDARLGNQRNGDPKEIARLSQKDAFTIEYFPPFKHENEVVSSSLIRKNIQEGDLRTAEKLLGRPFSIRGEVTKGKGKGKILGFPTANLPLKDLCLPRFGVYKVSAFHKNTKYHGIANLGIAPTVHRNRAPDLEVHLFDYNGNLYGETLEVELHSFIRPEKKFSSLEGLKQQIHLDRLSVAEQPT